MSEFLSQREEFLSQREVDSLLKGCETDYRDLWNDERAENAILQDKVRSANKEIERLRNLLLRVIGVTE